MSSADEKTMNPRRMILLLLVAGFLSPAAAAVAAPAAEYQLKASYLYHFTKFITWPDEASKSGGRFYLCILGPDPFGRAVDALAGKPTGLGEIVVQRHADPAAMTHCHLSYVNLPSATDQDAALARLTRAGSLTIGEAEGFLERGGVMRFVTVDDRVRFEVKEANIQRAGLKVGAKLLSVAIRK